jgi:RNA polymerase sigma-70 factor (ECF subfamily)
LIDHEPTNKPKTEALFALMCFHASRFDARTDENGEIIRYDDQDKTLWNEELISKGNLFLNRSSRGTELSRYHIQAAIAYWHTVKNDSIEKWENILVLYNQLLIIVYSPITALNRTYAISKIYGKERAIDEAQKLGLEKNHLYHVLLGYLHTESDQHKAIYHLKIALALAKTEKEKKLIRTDIGKFGNLEV